MAHAHQQSRDRRSSSRVAQQAVARARPQLCGRPVGCCRDNRAAGLSDLSSRSEHRVRCARCPQVANTATTTAARRFAIVRSTRATGRAAGPDRPQQLRHRRYSEHVEPTRSRQPASRGVPRSRVVSLRRRNKTSAHACAVGANPRYSCAAANGARIVRAPQPERRRLFRAVAARAIAMRACRQKIRDRGASNRRHRRKAPPDELFRTSTSRGQSPKTPPWPLGSSS